MNNKSYAKAYITEWKSWNYIWDNIQFYLIRRKNILMLKFQKKPIQYNTLVPITL